MYPTNDPTIDPTTSLSRLMQAQQSEQLPQFFEQLADLARDNPLIAVGGLVVVLFLTSLLPVSRRTRTRTRSRTYGGRPLSYHLGRALGDIVRGSRRR